ncbi:TPA: hypothetical protein HLT81_24775 [Escherichia coli]|nr:hypothetical protein [Escherichia coli]
MAGRVQSAALKIIYDRQKQIEAYWTIAGFLKGVNAHQKVDHFAHHKVTHLTV